VPFPTSDSNSTVSYSTAMKTLIGASPDAQQDVVATWVLTVDPSLDHGAGHEGTRGWGRRSLQHRHRHRDRDRDRDR